MAELKYVSAPKVFQRPRGNSPCFCRAQRLAGFRIRDYVNGSGPVHINLGKPRAIPLLFRPNRDIRFAAFQRFIMNLILFSVHSISAPNCQNVLLNRVSRRGSIFPAASAASPSTSNPVSWSRSEMASRRLRSDCTQRLRTYSRKHFETSE